MNKTTFETTYSDSAGTFADNTTRSITEAYLRQFAQDIADSLLFSGGLNWTTVEIGDWNMDTTDHVVVPHGLSDFKKIRSITGIIRNDTDTEYFVIGGHKPDDSVGCNFGAAPTGSGGNGGITATTVNINRAAGSDFNAIDFDSTSYNRGWVTIGYES